MCQFYDIQQTNVSFSALDTAHIVSMKVGTLRQFLLRELLPSQTLCNRSFVQAGTSSGYVDNEAKDGILFVNETPTIFNLLSDAGKSWRVC